MWGKLITMPCFEFTWPLLRIGQRDLVMLNNNMYTALALFERTKCIDWILFCYIRSLILGLWTYAYLHFKKHQFVIFVIFKIVKISNIHDLVFIALRIAQKRQKKEVNISFVIRHANHNYGVYIRSFVFVSSNASKINRWCGSMGRKSWNFAQWSMGYNVWYFIWYSRSCSYL
jgi:hypothetical protein